MSTYEPAPDVPPAHIDTFRAVRGRAKRGEYDETITVLSDFYEDVTRRPDTPLRAS